MILMRRVTASLLLRAMHNSCERQDADQLEVRMEGVALVIILCGWMVTMGGMLMTDAVAARLVLALVGLGASAGGMLALNATDLEHAIWKKEGTTRVAN